MKAITSLHRVRFIAISLSIFISLTIGYQSQNNAATNTTYYAFCYSPFRAGQDPNRGIYPSRYQIRQDLQIISKFTTCIRTYGVTDSLYDIPFIANEIGLNCYVGIWLGKDKEKNEMEINSAIKITQANLANVKGFIVGNEVILRKDLQINVLSQYIKRIKNITKIPVGTADIYPSFYQNPSIVEKCDFILAHIHPYWEKVAAKDATAHVIKTYKGLKFKYPNKTIMIGETGYPSAGKAYGSAVPSQKNQDLFFKEFTREANKANIPYFYFDVFDEDWKSIGTGEGEAGKHWGLYDTNGNLKPLFSGTLPVGINRSPDKTLDPEYPVLINGKLTSGFGMGVDDSEHLRNWVSPSEDFLQIHYPGGLSWGAVFMTVGGDPVDRPRPHLDFSRYTRLVIEMKGLTGDEYVCVGLKDAQDPDNGAEAKEVIRFSTDWKVYEFELSDFETCQLDQIYVVAEFVFPYLDYNQTQTIQIKNITFTR